MKRLFLLLAACGGDDGGSCPAYANIVGGTFARAGAMRPGRWSGDIVASVAGNAITIVVDDSEDTKLPMVTQPSQGTWNTITKFGPSLSDQCEDEFKP